MTTAWVTDWLWRGRGPGARAARAALLPLAIVYGVLMWLRAMLYRWGVLRTRALPLPSVAVGNLAVGGAGKTPLAAWIAAFVAARGKRPGILLRGYGVGDEDRVHARLVPSAVVVADPDRAAGAARARAAGAEVLVLDDAFQRLDVARDVNVAVLAAESIGAVPWTLPAGPWREGFGALRRADVIIVTRRRVPAEAAHRLARWLKDRWPGTVVAAVHLDLGGFTGMRSGRRAPADALAEKRVVVAAGVADPQSFAAQVGACGASVQLVAYQDHHAYAPADVERLAQAARSADYVVVTEKDAVKLRERWPADAPEPLVADLVVRWDLNGDAVTRVLEGMLRRLL
ncbi:MAG: tetraacyldisaccharide 4'-kinase [Gemmatimonadales bacterium]